MKSIRSISDLRVFMHRNEQPIYFISATNFNLLGIDQWVRNLRYINYIDCFDGRHPNVFVPSEVPHAEFESIEDINNYLLQHKEVIDHIKSHGGRPVATFLMFDDETEELCKELGIEVWFPKAKLRQRCDNKMETVRIGNKAGVASVPNALAKVGSYAELRKITEKAGIGHDLVIQTAFGDSGHTTFFISNEQEFDRHAKEIVNDPEVKIMKRIKCRGATMEGCATRSGTLVGPLLTEVVGRKELTPYKGGWCGNEVFPGAFTERVRTKARHMAVKFGDQLVKEGYRGYFDLDFLIDEKDGQVYLGELNPRICGASSMTNHAAFAYADAPLFLFHLLEFSGLRYKLDVEELNKRWSKKEFIDSWAQLVIKSTDETVDLVTHAPPTGIYHMAADGSVSYDRFDYNRQAIESEKEAFFLRITGPGDYRYQGADLGILITRGRVMDKKFDLNERARDWIKGIKKLYAAKPLTEPQVEEAPAAGSFKIFYDRSGGGAAYMELAFEAVDEDRPGPKWRALFDRHWHAYSRWFLREGVRARPTYMASLRAIKQHMPDLLPAYEEIIEVAGGGDLEARFLAMWCPPVYVGGCSQLILPGREPALIRNYDYSPKLLEGTWLASRLHGRRVLAMVDCLWGVLDGINEDGLALSLSFGGRTVAGKGFGIPIVMRYVLEFAKTTAEAVKMFSRVPVHMSYTISAVDRKGRPATIFVNPDRSTEAVDQLVSTNHQHQVEWPRHATATRSVERAAALQATVDKGAKADAALGAFFRPPLFQTSYAKGYGTLYTALYRPLDASCELVWRSESWRQSCNDFHDDSRIVQLGDRP